MSHANVTTLEVFKANGILFNMKLVAVVFPCLSFTYKTLLQKSELHSFQLIGNYGLVNCKNCDKT
jgi:hypothetical protein